ncbi:kinase-like domain-containing protein [Talaromyces proteolyticus]|uniref:Kinase-like domain-containing protein n=1 Tax=Talaromyces proteolyticus TaxID=1131652 RepID=A0AAD4KSB6_9EURO|nr:kinase-like domain-containing protein [Talaromyces proteolyticus]KAH8696000.1 kinase-like domain-containing protein [Talaromyces proteolyticus]
MDITGSCSACSWSPERQENCRYESHVKLFYGVSDRGVWSLGSHLILKERSNKPPNFEASNIRFLREKTSIPLPTVVEDWTEENGRYFMLMKRIPGKPLSTLWADMPTDEREKIAKQTANSLMQLRKLHSHKMQALNDQPIFSAFLFPNGYGLPHGPFSSDDELWVEMDMALKGVPKDARLRLRERIPPAAPYTFTHGDLTYVNIMVENGHLTGIIDWEASGYFPVWWEFTCSGIGLSQEDKEWKTLLQKYMPDYTGAREFWLDFYALSKYPNLDERGMELLRDKDRSSPREMY